MDELLSRIAARTSLDEPTLRVAIGHILAFMSAEGDASAVSRMLARAPGTQEALAAAGSTGGGGFGGIMGLGATLMGLGLDFDQTRIVAGELVAFAKIHAGEATVERAIASVPGLSQFA